MKNKRNLKESQGRVTVGTAMTIDKGPDNLCSVLYQYMKNYCPQ